MGAAYVLTTNGTRRRIVVYGTSSDDVGEKLRRKMADSDKGIPVSAKAWTMAEYLRYWLEHVVKVRRPKTYQGYEGIVRNYLIPGLGKKKLHRLTAPDVRTFFTQVRSRCRCCTEGIDARREEPRCCAIGRCCDLRLSVRSVQFIHAVLRNALQNAMREELVGRNVAKLVQVETPNYRVNRGLSVEQARTLLREASGDRWYAFYVLALYLGMRRGELLGLRWRDVDFEAQQLEIVNTLQRVDGELRFVPPKTRSSERTIPLPQICLDALKAHRARQAEDRLKVGDYWQDSDCVFATVIGTPVEPDNIRRSWYPLRERIGLEGVKLHDLRHSCVTLLLSIGVPPNVVREIVGHAHIGVTMEIYAHASLDQMRAALKRLDEHLA